jgi:hypothetical protein
LLFVLFDYKLDFALAAPDFRSIVSEFAGKGSEFD